MTYQYYKPAISKGMAARERDCFNNNAEPCTLILKSRNTKKL
uniref:Uncharacterized protein n=1 Tax=Rhizophora mucronata TaxID=61149 RepID=A0A2P2JQ68_RHIMU